MTLWNLNYDEKQFANDSKEFANDTKEFANSEKQFANDTKEALGGDAEGVLQFFGMRSDEGYVFFSCFHFYYSCIFNAFALSEREGGKMALV